MYLKDKKLFYCIKGVFNDRRSESNIDVHYGNDQEHACPKWQLLFRNGSLQCEYRKFAFYPRRIYIGIEGLVKI